jgi:hypothetical protein
MMMNQKCYLFYPEDIEPDEVLLRQTNCLRLPIAWVLSGRQTQDAAQWLVDACAYLEIARGQEIPALCTGYAQLLDLCTKGLSLRSDVACEQLEQMLSSHCRYQLAGLEEGAVAFPPLAALPVLRDAAAELVFGKGGDESQLYFYALRQAVLPAGWLENMAAAQRVLFADSSDESAVAVGLLWQQMMDLLLPEALQTAAFVENCLYYTAQALSAAYAEESEIWTAVTQSFLDTMEVEEVAQ